MKNKAAYILTGGFSRRFGNPKCTADFNGRPMLESVAASLDPVFENIYQVGKKQYGGLPFVADSREVQNPLAGIVTALEHGSADWIFVIACDLPLVDRQVIERLGREIGDDAQAVLPEVAGQLQFACAFYRRDLSELFKHELDAGNYAVHRLVARIRHKAVLFPAADQRFLNVNTPADMEQAVNIKKGRD